MMAGALASGSSLPVRLLNATPPVDFPAQCIILDREFAQQHLTKGFYLRVQVGPLAVEHVDLEALSLPAARQEAREKGYAPTHWMEIGDRAPMRM